MQVGINFEPAVTLSDERVLYQLPHMIPTYLSIADDKSAMGFRQNIPFLVKEDPAAHTRQDVKMADTQRLKSVP